MAQVAMSTRLKGEYQRLFDSCRIRPPRRGDVDRVLAKIEGNRRRYVAVERKLGIPWYVVGVIHNMESSLRFDAHLHNGDPLTRRTVREPPGRPARGSPPFNWEESAIDALTMRRLDRWKDWSVGGSLYQLEAYNGWGYRLHHPHVLSPYLWSFSNHYASGKYVADGTWSDRAVSQQCGAGVLLRRLAEKGVVGFKGAQPPRQPPLRWSPGRELPQGKRLQEFLNGFPGIFLRVDGKPGRKTSDAFKKVTGRRLLGDPRGQK
jgi:lysozyme family protein